jgi:transcriptional regulator with XRE-family HTH domain
MGIHQNVPGKTHCNVQRLHDELEQRLKREITRSEVAQAINVDRRALEKWYTDDLKNFNGAILAALCHYYGVTISELLTTEFDPAPARNGG